MAAKQWYFRGGDGTIYGPISGVELREQARSGWVGPGTFVTTDSTDRWVAASHVKGLFPDWAGEPGRSASTAAAGHRHEQTSHQGSVPNNVFAIVSLISGVLCYVVAPVIGAAVAIITGHVALRQIERSEEREDGKILAVIGLILGYIHAVLSLAAAIAVMFLGISLATFLGILLRLGGQEGAPPARPLPINPPPFVRPGAFGPFPSPAPNFAGIPKAPRPGAGPDQGGVAVGAIPRPAPALRPALAPPAQAFELQGSWDVTGTQISRPYIIEFGVNRSVTVRHNFGTSSISPWSYGGGIINFGGSIRINEIEIQGPWETRLQGEDEFEVVDPNGKILTLKRRPPRRLIAP